MNLGSIELLQGTFDENRRGSRAEHQRNAERLLTALTGMTLLSRSGERFTNAPDVARFLVKDSNRYAGPWILFTKPRWERYGRLSEMLRERDENVLGAYTEFTVEDARRYHAATSSIGFGAGRKFCRDVDLSRWLRGGYAIPGGQAEADEDGEDTVAASRPASAAEPEEKS